jgi:hypothetical protein
MITAKPSLGQTVIYKSKIDNGLGNDVLSPAMIIRTRATTVAQVVDRWSTEPTTVASASDGTVSHETAGRPADFVAELPDDNTVDLIVFGLGKTYREYAVPVGMGRGQWSHPSAYASSVGAWGP